MDTDRFHIHFLVTVNVQRFVGSKLVQLERISKLWWKLPEKRLTVSSWT